MKKILALLFIISSFSTQIYSQKEYNIQDFSQLYNGKVYVEDVDTEETTVTIKIFDKHTQKLLIETQAEINLSYDMTESGEIDSNTMEVPYGMQSLVICGDFNCDGVDDIAIKIGNYSCYGGPAFDIYLNEKGVLVKNDMLTSLAQDYCGMFQYDCEKKEINVMTKSGCCYHIFETYSIANDTPELVKRIEANAMGYFPLITTTETKDGQDIARETPYWEAMGDDAVAFQFTLQNTGKSVVLWLFGDYLLYTLLNKEGDIEFMYSRNTDQDENEFQLSENKKRTEVMFSNASAKYTIYESADSVGVEVLTKGKTYNMKGDIETKTGSILSFDKKEIKNMTRNK